MSWTPPVTRSPGYGVLDTDWNAIQNNLLVLKTSISDDGTVWSGSITVAPTTANATFNFVIVAGAGASAPKISTALTYNPSTGVFTGSISNQTTGFRINGAAAAGTIIRGDGTNYVASTTTWPNAGSQYDLLYFSATNVVSALAGAANAVLVTSGTGLPSLGTTLPAVSGANLTNLNATNLSSGTVADARLSANVPLLNANTVFTGSFQINNATVAIGSRSVGSIPLHIQDAANDDAGLDLYRVSSTEMQIQCYNRAGSTYTSLSFNSLNYKFSFAGTELLRMHASGGVSIGSTTDPGAGTLDVSTAITLGGFSFASGPGITWGIFVASTGFQMITWPTTGSAANAVVTNGTNIARSTSLRRFKQDIESISADEARRVVLGLRPVTYRSAIPTDDRTRLWPGLIAEDVEAVTSLLGTYDDGVLSGVAYDRVPVYLTVLGQDHERRIAALEAELAELKQQRIH